MSLRMHDSVCSNYIIFGVCCEDDKLIHTTESVVVDEVVVSIFLRYNRRWDDIFVI